MIIARVRLLVILLLVGGGLSVGCQQTSTSDVDQTEEGVLRLGSVSAVDTVDRAVAPNDRPLIFDGFRGRVDLQGGDAETATVQFVRQARGEDAETARGVLEDVTVSEEGSEQNYTFTMEAGGGAYSAVDVSGTVPRATALEVNLSSGPVTIADVDGPLTVSHKHGPVTIRGAAASVDVETKNGDLDVTLQSVPSDAEIALRTKNGLVTLRLPPDASVQLSAETNAGTIRTQGLALTNQEFMPRNAGGEYAAQLGTGDAVVDLHTANGSVLVQATGTTAEPDTAALSPPPSDTTVTPPSESNPFPEADTTTVDTMTVDTMTNDSAASDTVGRGATGADTSSEEGDPSSMN